MRVLFILPHPVEGPSSRFRAYQFLPWLAAHGVQATVRPFLSSARIGALYRPGGLATKAALTAAGLAFRLRDALEAGRHDVVVVLREAFALGPPLLERMMARRDRLVFDFDDAIWTPSLAYPNPVDRLRDFGKTAAILGLARGVIAGNAHLADYAAAHARPGTRIDVLPTVVDAAVYRPAPRPSDGTVTVGWIGTPRGSSYLRDLVPALRAVARRRPEVRFVFVGAEPFDAEGAPVTFRDWSLTREPADVAGFDVGLMPLTDDAETRGKCAFKLVQYMACGVPGIASPVGANLEVLSDGETGLFAKGTDAWADAMDRLIGDAALRGRMGAAGRARAEAAYSLTAVAPRLLAALRAAAG